MLHTLGTGPYSDTIHTVTQPKSEEGLAYASLRGLFTHTKRLYGRDVFLSPDKLELSVPEHRLTIRKANLATFVISIFGSNEVGFFHLNDSFLDVFIPEGGRLLKQQGGLFLELKTQSYISAIGQDEKSQDQILQDLFEDNMEDKLLNRRDGTRQLIPSEADFVNRANSRREYLRGLSTDYAFLVEKFQWTEFLRELIFYVAKNQEAILSPVVSTINLINAPFLIRE